MALIDRLLLRNAEQTARAEAKRVFRDTMPGGGSFRELEESGITSYYDRVFGAFEPSLDRWDGSQGHILRANPQLRRLDVVADTIFHSGGFSVKGVGDIRSPADPRVTEGTIAAISLKDRPGNMVGMLTLDIGEEIRFTKLRIGTERSGDFIIRPSALDYGMVIYPNMPGSRSLPEAINDKAAEGSEVFQTIQETIIGVERLLRVR